MNVLKEQILNACFSKALVIDSVGKMWNATNQVSSQQLGMSKDEADFSDFDPEKKINIS